IPRTENGRLIPELRLIERRILHAVPYFVVGGADSEPVTLAVNERPAERVRPMPVVGRQRAVLHLKSHCHRPPGLAIQQRTFRAAGPGEAAVRPGAKGSGREAGEHDELIAEFGDVVVRRPLLAPREVADRRLDADEAET